MTQHEALDNALQCFWLKCWDAAAEARRLAGADERENYALFRQLAPSLEVVRARRVPSNRRKQLRIEESSPCSSPTLRRRNSVEEVFAPKSKAYSFRHNLHLFDPEDPEGEMVAGLPDCPAIRERFTTNAETFDVLRHRVYERDSKIVTVGEGERRYNLGEDIVVTECYQNQIVTHTAASGVPLMQDVALGIASPWKLLSQLTCPICFRPVRESLACITDASEETFGAKIPPCGHLICTPCLRLIRKMYKRCPSCRGSLQPIYDFKPVAL